MLVGTGGGVSVGGDGTGVGVLVGGEGVGVSVGGGIGVGVGKLFDVPCSPSLPGGTTATLAGVGVKVGHGVRVGGASASAGLLACRAPSPPVNPHPRLTNAKARANPKTTLVDFFLKTIAALRSIYPQYAPKSGRSTIPEDIQVDVLIG